MVDVIFSDVAQPDQTEIVMNNAKHYLKRNGYVLIAIKVTSLFPSFLDPFGRILFKILNHIDLFKSEQMVCSVKVFSFSITSNEERPSLWVILSFCMRQQFEFNFSTHIF